ncbi:type II secretion system minor pseudopilin GspK [Hellea balneolensis]|uniref:type II secretion system minor pseudopilin GspK n=1 Tax=Hellea balneolensis TaxID=287478 RepID=UPI0004184FE1|nr:type II secretion system minor pseudopilin GspK [Hellea balneolensis]
MRHQDKERGTVLLTTLLIMAVMAAVSVAIMDDIRFAVKRTINVGDYAQADWYVKGAEDFAESYISSQLGPMQPAVKNELFKTPQTFTFPYDGGMMILDVRDGTDCFALGSLVNSSGAANVVGGRQFTNLLIALGWPDNDARSLTAALTDWIDSDSQRSSNGAEDGDYLRRDPPHRTANTALTSVMELRSLEGMTEELYQSIRPFLCARKSGETAKLNIDTAEPIDAFLLSTILGGPEHYQAALQLITERPAGGYGTLETLQATSALQNFTGKEAAFDQIVYAPEYLWVEVRVDYLNASRLVTYEYDVSAPDAELTYRGWGSESYRPTLEQEERQPQ